MGPVGIGLVVLVAGAIAWRLFAGERHDSPFTVEVRGPGVAGVHLRGAVPGIDAATFTEFVASLELTVGARVWATKDRGRLSLRFAGVPEGPAQRLRNFVYSRY